MERSALPEHAQPFVTTALQADEHIYWFGCPKPSALVIQSLPLLLFGVPWTAISLFFVCFALGVGHSVPSGPGSMFKLVSLPFLLIGVPFVLIGFALLCQPLWQLYAADKTFYLVTDSRALIMTPNILGTYRIKSLYPSDLQSMSRIERSDGRGDLILSTEAWVDSDGDHRTRREAFYGLRSVRELESLINTGLLGR